MLFSDPSTAERLQNVPPPGWPPGADSAAADESARTGAGGRLEVLLVEDEATSRRALARLLTASGYAPRAAGSAEEALGLLRHRRPPRIAVVDLNLPGMDGLDLLRQLSAMDPSVVPILITAAGGDALRAALDRRGVAYLRKPIDFNRLLRFLDDAQARQ